MTNYLFKQNGLHSPYGAYSGTAAQAVDAGQFLKPIGSATLTTSTYKTAATAAISVDLVDGDGDEALFCGIAGYDQDSGGIVSVYTKGIFLMEANDTITAGAMVCPEVGNADSDTIVVAEAGGRQIGIALTPCSAGEYALVLMTGIGPTGAEA